MCECLIRSGMGCYIQNVDLFSSSIEKTGDTAYMAVSSRKLFRHPEQHMISVSTFLHTFVPLILINFNFIIDDFYL